MDTYAASPNSPAATQLVGLTFGRRAASYVVDLIILYVTTPASSVTACLLLGVALYVLDVKTQTPQEYPILSWLIAILIGIAYFAVFEWLFGATPGKAILGMRVVKEDGSPCGLRAALIRS